MTMDIDGFFCVVIIVSINVVLLCHIYFSHEALSEISQRSPQKSHVTRTIAKSSLLVVVGQNIKFQDFSVPRNYDVEKWFVVIIIY